MMYRAALGTAVLCWVGVLAAALLTLGTPGFWLDEMMASRVAAQPGWLLWWNAIPPDKPPLDYFVLRLVSHIGGDEWTLRLPAWFFLSITSLVVAFTGAAALGRGGTERLLVGASAAVLYSSAVVPFRMGQQALPYSQLCFWLAVSFCGVMLATGDSAGRRRAGLVLAVLGGAAASLTAYTAVLSVLPLALCLLAVGIRHSVEAWKPWISAAVFLGVALIPIGLAYSGMREQYSEPSPWLFPDGVALLSTLRETLVGPRGGPVWSHFGALAELLLLFFGCVSAWRCSPLLFACLVGWLAGALVLTVGVFWLRDHWLAPRYFVPVWLPLALLQALGVALLLSSVRKSPRKGVLPLLLLLGLLTVSRATGIAEDRGRMPDHPGAVALLLEQEPDTNSLVLADHEISAYSASFYLERHGYPQRVVVFDAEDPVQALQANLSPRVLIYRQFFDGHTPEVVLAEHLHSAPLPGPLAASLLYRITPRPHPAELPLRISGGASDEMYLLKGWHAPETWGEDLTIRWVESTAILGAVVERNAGGVRVRMRVMPRDVGDGRPRNLRLHATEGSREYELIPGVFQVIGFQAGLDEGLLLLQIGTSDVLDGVQGDPRDLSFAVDWLELQHVPPHPSP